MSVRKFENPVPMGFDPAKITDEALLEVFANDVARTIWISWRPRHIVSQNFNRMCVNLADELRIRVPLDAPALNATLRWRYAFEMGTNGDIEWCEQALPFILAAIRGEKDNLLQYIYREKS